jgi:methionyl-tRNA formyltransferase
LLTETLRRLERGRLTPTPQDDGKATEAPLLRREMGLVSWEEPAELLSRRVRAFDPWPPVIATCRKGILRLLEAVPAGSERVSEPPGTVLGRDGDALRIACGGGTVLRLERVQPEGRRPMDGTACLAGRYVGTGERLGDGPAP